MSRYDATLAETITLTSQDGEPIEAYVARPLTDRPLGGVVVLHHEPGYDEASKEYTRRLAVYGFNTICPHLHHRENPWGDPDDAAAEMRRLGAPRTTGSPLTRPAPPRTCAPCPTPTAGWG
ncbi:dienelactone hydrolase family protein [Streptomyces scabiei]|uniref:dienelactone hydrolase family protein n=1 Tax=Streptomyces scabiei TaxID=1930 RepID=UPI0029BACC2E|nr:dienelactone hydrolase family protein [Streptomyces scabiei]MDX3035308.1 dienelactone hydrolase family protein [Streptomyces scabiei]MDX3213788.1 dienelactone hydrolase family protein [Streptomyces scabiei]